MVSKPELIKGGGGSVKVGTTGTISSLITKELGYMNIAQATTLLASKRKSPPTTVSIRSGSTSKTSLQRRRTINEASTSSSNSSNISNINQRSTGTSAKYREKIGKKGSHKIPMLRSEDIPLERTPDRVKTIVEVVDIKCGKVEKGWSSPISSRLKKLGSLGFSKLSVSIG